MINRTRIIGSGGPVILTVPLAGGRDQKTSIKEIRIDNSQFWQKRHWRTIFSCYNRSPWFSYYREDLQPFFEKQHTFLIDFVLAGQAWIYDKLGWKQTWEVLKDKPADIDTLNRPANLESFRYSYHQVFQEKVGFHPDLSILDLLFCEGAARANELLGKKGG